MPSNVVVKSHTNCSLMNRVMLRFRPIAPKPPAGREHNSDLPKINGSVKRTKRKYVRVQTKHKNILKPPENTFVTLQLLPERSESEQICSAEENLENNRVDEGGYMKSLRSVVIIVESIFGNDNIGLGFTDKDKVSNLEADACPGFVSDCNNKVVWVNDAYRRMVMDEDCTSGVCVSLVVNEELPYNSPSFACRVRVKQGHKWNKIVACDVWKMDFQGFAWKLLDVNTALSL